jgi:hypothetical protein
MSKVQVHDDAMPADSSNGLPESKPAPSKIANRNSGGR